MSEKDIAQEIGAKLIKNSGRGHTKGDMVWRDYYIVDAKEGASLNLNASVWRKICSDASTHGGAYTPVILRVLPNGIKIACIPFYEFEELVRHWNDC